jgi:hypothetical protein
MEAIINALLQFWCHAKFPEINDAPAGPIASWKSEVLNPRSRHTWDITTEETRQMPTCICVLVPAILEKFTHSSRRRMINITNPILPEEDRGDHSGRRFERFSA